MKEIRAVVAGHICLDMIPNLEHLKPGQFSEPVKTADGFHVLKLTEIMPAVDKHLEEVKDEIQESLTTLRLIEQREKWLDDLFAKAAIKRNL